ncbi:reverse transcriptase [Abeliophyllum distichum]|uniref:Reverse transcriptase n=1 Tax=Abeliophyllum distichum TaxID=126358 RepID=A0ABD1T2L0_9LAMI
MPKRALPPIRVLLRLLLASNRYSLILWILIKVPSLLKRRASLKSGNEISKLFGSYLEKAQKQYKKSADQKHRFLEFNVGDLVMVKLPEPTPLQGNERKDSRLMSKYIGPLPIMKRIGRVAYRIELPS